MRRRRRTSAAAPAGSAAPTTRSSTSTAAARRSSRSSPARTSTRPRTRAASCSSCARRSSSSGSRTPRWRRGRCASTRTSPSARPGRRELRTRCELKNMNSFRFVAQGIDAEVARQIAIYESGGEVVQETYDFDAGSGTLTARRSKEEADDYRYFPEPDLVPVEPPAELVERLRAELPEQPGAHGSAGSRPSSTSIAPSSSSPAGSTGSGRRPSRPAPSGAGGERDREPARRRRQRTPSIPRELAKLVEARDRIPRAALDEALAQGRRSRASPPRLPRAGGRLGHAPSWSRSSRGSSTPTPARSPPTAAARRACSASSSAR